MNFPLPPLVVLSAGCLLACSSTQEPSPDGSGGAAHTGGALVGTGGSGTGGSGTGGASATGGSATAGGATGGMATGGSAAGGTTTGGTTGSGGLTATGGAGNGGDGAGGSNGGSSAGGSSGLSKGACTLGAGNHMEMGRTEAQYLGVDVTRDGKNYRMITNGWGTNWLSHDMSWFGTALTIHSYEGSRQSNGAPAGFPTVFCGKYSNDESLPCGLPMALSEVTALNTAAAWSHPDGNGTYNVSYDVWLGDGNATGRFGGLESYFMVWMRDPAGEQPAGSPHTEGVVISDIPGQWNIIAGTVNNLPIVNYVRAEGDDLHEMAFDIMDFVRDAQSRELTMPGNDVLAVAIGFEIWAGPVTNLSLDDFCIDIQ